MRIALVDSNPRPRVYPIALLKLGAWRKSLGDQVKLFSDRLPRAGEFDEVWITTTFTYDLPHALGLVKAAAQRADRVFVGGVAASLLPSYFSAVKGVQVHVGLVPEAEAQRPDYGLLDAPPDYSITHTSRGCVRRCSFCMVHKVEPTYQDRPEWVDDLYPGAKRILFYDNNWLAKQDHHIKRDVEAIKWMVERGEITSVDFNQGLDARLLTEKLAELLEGVPFTTVRFAFDHMGEDGHFQAAIRRMAAHGHKNYLAYVLYNFKDTPSDFYYRLRASAELSSELRINADSFPMKYQPIMEVGSERKYTGPGWTSAQRRAFRVIMSNHSGPAGTVTGHSHNTWDPVEEFSYWFGDSPERFVKLLNYPKLRQLMGRKKGALRMKRAQGGPLVALPV